MGWDALAIRNGAPLAMASKHCTDHWDIRDLPLKEEFNSAAASVRELGGRVSEALLEGQLSGSSTRAAFELVFSLSFQAIPDSVLVWSPDQVRNEYSRIGWLALSGESSDKDILQIREFVRICEENELGIHFGW